jgi:lysophospholipase L1-like esterase
MKLMKVILGSIALSTVFALSTGAAMADTQTVVDHHKQLVALGDSISYGYNLGLNNDQPSKYAFPYLLGRMQHAEVQDLAVPGATSVDLLNSLQSQQVRAALQDSDIVTIDIGSNDLLSIASRDGFFTNPPSSLTVAEQAQFASAIQQFSRNLPAILQTVHTLAPSAHIVLYNLYDPFSMRQLALHTIGEQMIGEENQIISTVAGQANLPVVDAYDLFNNHQDILILPNDVHPTKLGQDVLAIGGEMVLIREEVSR